MRSDANQFDQFNARIGQRFSHESGSSSSGEPEVIQPDFARCVTSGIKVST